MTDHFDVNRANWDERAAAHELSPDYELERFVADPAYLSGVVRFDLPRLGEIAGLDVVHLQCHIGTDTISLARLGAHVTGLDFSPEALVRARALAHRVGASVGFVEANVYDAPAALAGRAFDLVYTGVGALCWLPDIRRWAAVIAKLLRPGGRLFLREAHPVLQALADPREDGLLVLEYPYFEQPEPVIWDEATTYVASDHVFTATTSHQWNHGLGEIVSALLAEGLALTRLEEHDTAPWEAIGLGRMALDPGSGERRLIERPERLPCTFTLEARAPHA